MKKIRLKDELTYAVEIVEHEFPKKEWEELFELVYGLILKNDTFFDMQEVDKFDYLVDGILEIEGYFKQYQ